MLREAILNVDNIEVFGAIALVVMLLVFAGVIVWVVRLDKQVIDTLGRLPLDSAAKGEEADRV